MHRPWFYWHHGIFVDNDRVIEFGGNGQKSDASIRVTTLTGFARGNSVEIVKYGNGLNSLGTDSAHAREQVVRRAEALLRDTPQSRYHLIAWNCEHVATYCVTGVNESEQVRAAMFWVFVPLVIVLPLILDKRVDNLKRALAPFVAFFVILGHKIAKYSETGSQIRKHIQRQSDLVEAHRAVR